MSELGVEVSQALSRLAEVAAWSAPVAAVEGTDVNRVRFRVEDVAAWRMKAWKSWFSKKATFWFCFHC